MKFYSYVLGDVIDREPVGREEWLDVAADIAAAHSKGAGMEVVTINVPIGVDVPLSVDVELEGRHVVDRPRFAEAVLVSLDGNSAQYRVESAS